MWCVSAKATTLCLLGTGTVSTQCHLVSTSINKKNQNSLVPYLFHYIVLFTLYHWHSSCLNLHYKLKSMNNPVDLCLDKTRFLVHQQFYMLAFCTYLKQIQYLLEVFICSRYLYLFMFIFSHIYIYIYIYIYIPVCICMYPSSYLHVSLFVSACILVSI